ncbi:AraC family transcriptional regulator [Hydrogenophaga sp. OTU3427]|uniref:AraC family transcriptional regulator n=1 Tax=Hydrogenophaga sp. OTU3427 TaxID=3043856 RepID=UPI00313E462F
MKRACFHPAYLRKLCQRASDEGHDPATLLRRTGMAWAELQGRESFLSFDEGRLVILACQAAIGRPTLALEQGRSTQLSDHGSLGLLMASSAHLRDALLAFNHFSNLRTGVTEDLVRFEDRGAWVVCAPRFPLGDIKAFTMDHLAGTLSRIFSALSGSTLDSVHLELPWQPPPWRHAYHALAGTVRFGANRMAFWLPASLLDRPCHTASRSLFSDAWQLCDLQVKRLSQVATLSETLHHTLLYSEGDWPGEAQLAAQLGMSRSTLVRRLQKEGSSYRRLLEDVRKQRAMRQLRQGGQSVSEIAYRLGYTSESNFGRSFKRWLGMTPNAFRNMPAEPERTAQAGADSRKDVTPS